MKYEEFTAIVREKAQERLGEAYKVMVEKHMTNNGMLVDALCLNRAEEPPSPSLYLNTYFDLYQESMSLDGIMDEILEVYEWEEARRLSIREEWRDYKNVKKMIGMKLVNTAALLPVKIRDIKEILHEAARVRKGKAILRKSWMRYWIRAAIKGRCMC